MPEWFTDSKEALRNVGWAVNGLAGIAAAFLARPSRDVEEQTDLAETLIADAVEAQGSSEWGTAVQCYTKAIALLEKDIAECSDWAEREEAKHRALECWSGYCQAHVEAMRAPEIAFFDMSDVVREQIVKTETALRRYEFENKKHLWNSLERHYASLELESRREFRHYEAREYYYARIRARRLRLRASGDMLGYVRLSVGSALIHTLDRLSENFLLLFAVLIVIPVVVFTLAYWQLGALGFDSGAALPAGAERLWYSLYFSIATFTGAEPANLLPRCAGFWLSSVEALLAYLVTVIIIGSLLNIRSPSRWSS